MSAGYARDATPHHDAGSDYECNTALTGVAGAEDLEVVTDLTKSVLCGHCVGPSLHRRARDLNRTTADAADQMMVVAGRAPAIGRLTLVGSDPVELAYFGHEFEG